MKKIILLMITCSFAFAEEAAYKNYSYLSLGIPGTKELRVYDSQQFGLGYRIHHGRRFYIDGMDISISILTNKASINTYTQSIFPKVLFIRHLTKTRPVYLGIGAAYLRAQLERTKEHIIGGSPVKIREKKKLKDITASMAFGKTLYKSPSLISFAGIEIDIPSKAIFDSEYNDFIGIGFTVNAGF